MVVGRVNYLLRTLVLGAFAVVAWFGYAEVRDVLRGRDADLADSRAQVEELTAEVTGLETEVGTLTGQVETLGAEVVTLEAEVGVLEEEVVVLEEEVFDLQAALTLLKVDHRLATLEVLEQIEHADGRVETSVVFQELDEGGSPLGRPRLFKLPGRQAYVDGLVVKFDDDYVEAGDALRGTSICLFRRIFGEDQAPSTGFELDPVGIGPLPYTGDDDSPELRALWAQFWDFANDPELARKAGVRAIHGEAPFIETRPGARYVVELRASGGLSLRAE